MEKYINILFSSKRNYFIAIIILIALFSIMRFAFITADPPQDLSKSGALYSDEGFKTYSSRNNVLFGNWKWTPEDQYAGWVKSSPVSAFSYKYLFEYFGGGFVSIRLLSIIYSILTMIVLFVYCKRYFDDKTAILSLIIFGISFFNVMFNRLGFYEVHINFYFMMALLLFTESFITRKKIYSVLFFVLGVCIFLITFFIKKSSPIVIFSLMPAILLYICNRIGFSSEKIQKLFAIVLMSIFVIYVFFAHAFQLNLILKYIDFIKIGGHPLSYFLPVKSFDPVYLFVTKLFHLEFIFLHPFTFFISFIYAIYTFYNYPQKDKKYNIDFFLSSWLFFGFLILSFLKYHPARYYLLLALPMYILFARAIVSVYYFKLVDFYNMEKTLLYRIMLLVIKVMFVIYSGVIVVMQFLPFAFRSYIKNTFYHPLMTGDIPALLPVIIPVMFFLITLISFIIIKRDKINKLIGNVHAPRIFLVIIIILQLFQYGSWLIFHKDDIYSISRKLGQELPTDSIIAGSWSAQLVIENKLRSLILQHNGRYNYSVLDKIIKNKKIRYYEKKGDAVVEVEKNDLPLYIALSPDIIFERKIVKKYKEYFVPERLFSEVTAGYFNIKIYRIR